MDTKAFITSKPETSDKTTWLYDATKEQLTEFLSGQPKYRIEQTWKALYEQFQLPANITTLSKQLRTDLEQTFPPALELVTKSTADSGDTVKFLWHLKNGDSPIETVLMFYSDRATVCVSTQAGCAMACGFCATGQAGFTRQLTAGEILEQIARASRYALDRDRRVSNVVYMGMGEPLANEPAVHESVIRLHNDMGLSARHITISTVGIVPGIKQLQQWDLPVNLAVSLHAANDQLRDELVPINKRYPLAMLIDACNEYLAHKNRRISFEWALIDGVNDRDSDAQELAALCNKLRLPAHVNLIPLNPTPGWPTKASSANRVHAFHTELERLGVNATIRHTRGAEIDAACGQLAAGQLQQP